MLFPHYKKPENLFYLKREEKISHFKLWAMILLSLKLIIKRMDKKGAVQMEIPEEAGLISVFESLPKRKDETDTFYYDTSIYVSENEYEAVEITLSPFYDEFIMDVKDKKTNHVLSYLKLLSVNKMEIAADKKNHAMIRLFHGESDLYVNIVEITLKPRFKLIFREQYR
ncbi:hypothetical protein CYOC110262_24975 [Cytobacillus oceanisediminis]|uniref:Uncharacterized protein n=2 Tax=Cytobacillus oceanisediminis TaxID=665099 RepID=A0A562J5E7_9BACI|nr:hypothetical protein IQ19_05300 [Cytobacillus oceanisediminis]